MMRLTIESTNAVTTIDGVQVRLWEGRTAAGRRVLVFVHRVLAGADDEATLRELDGALRETDPPVELRRLLALDARHAP